MTLAPTAAELIGAGVLTCIFIVMAMYAMIQNIIVGIAIVAAIMNNSKNAPDVWLTFIVTVTYATLVLAIVARIMSLRA